MESSAQLIEDCIVKLLHMADDPFLEPDANAAWCRAIAQTLSEALEIMEYE
jgi:hypothetical protein